ncbi:hypothetical protein EV356DRAFT_508514 [Viridothelium virens]|uniref:Uncharacterized protein n=1 Tax=Viridothelium virens TaxID=1048519 RepID=A0A6A6GXR9_VIRVR|nr:hypothetical protein EV356DRAFT_508514 [Viridothelium virens]
MNLSAATSVILPEAGILAGFLSAIILLITILVWKYLLRPSRVKAERHLLCTCCKRSTDRS